MRLVIVWLWVALLSTFVTGQEMKFRHPLPPESEIDKKTIVFANDASGDLKIDMYKPVHARGKLPVIVFANVVGRMLGQAPFRNHPQYEGWGRAATTIGAAGVVMESGENPVANFDQLVGYLRAHAGELGIDPEQMVVWSCSANVKLGMPLITDPARKYIRGGVVYYGTGQVSTYRGDVPVLMVRAGLDSPGLNHGIEEIAAGGLKVNAPWTVINVAGGRHGFDGLDDNVESTDVIEQTLMFAKRVFQPEFQKAMAQRQTQAETAGLVNAGKWPEAKVAYEKMLAANPENDMAQWRFAQVLVELGQNREAVAHFQKALDLGNMNRGLISMQGAKAAMAIGDKELALKFLEGMKGIKVMTVQAKGDPAFAALKEDARFKAIVEED